jgi:hypothetical protein
MAKLKYKHYDEYIDYDGPTLLAISMEENGVIYTYRLRDKECYVSEIEEGVDNVVIADEIRVDSVGICPVVRWGIPLIDRKCVSNVKSIELGKNLKKFNDLTTSDLENLERLVIPESIEKFPPFTNCNNLKEITMPAKFSLDLEQFAWAHPKLQKMILLHEGKQSEITEKELSAKRYSYQKKVDREEEKRITEEKRLEKEKRYQESVKKFTEWYIAIVCAVPYLWAIVNAFRNMVNYELDFIDIIMQLIAAGVLAFGLFIAWGIAIECAFYLVDRSDRKILTAIFVPIITIPFSWIVFNIALGLLTAFNSCSDGFYGMVDPRFI